MIVGLALAGLLATTSMQVAAASRQGGDPAVVSTDNGPVRGTVADDHRSFQGIPYAAPPTGERRWRSPQPAARWSGVRDATEPGSSCPQNQGFLPDDRGSIDEDCLFLNVTTPPRPAGPRPVMVFMHGDGFANGSSRPYGARPLAIGGDVVVVTVNYRINVFGFLAHPDLPGSGNFGIEDQQAALRWVQRNVAAFGGDSRNVTVFGESAGATSTCAHLLSPGSAGLFHRAIIQSGACTMRRTYLNDWGFQPSHDAERRGRALAEQHGCTDAATLATCLRGKTVAQLLDMPDGGFGFGPVHGDNSVLPRDPEQALKSGRFNQVPVMHGTTRDEHRTFTAGLELMLGRVLQPGDYPKEIHANFGTDAHRVLAEYPLGGQNPSIALSKVATDSSWGCQALFTDRLFARYVPTYAFEFADRNAPWFAGVDRPSFPTGAFHGGELQYLFDGAYGTGALTADQRRLSDRMVRYWSGFARNGHPNNPGMPWWPRFHRTSEPVLSLNTGAGGIRPVDFDREHRCQFWREVGQD
ncbi:para-nitrobenzyl esterase [Prauserella marina]|uniref:Carboxylic ester hydrolase n=2 Tax=Prauserella marina TaxID=530584 RepID=A0A1G6Y0P8_9PSEU|nr:carboxylesterase type B [Prauserella marina]SDD83989.1 para-nitrobenzyl esterase [Prauserella marina]